MSECWELPFVGVQVYLQKVYTVYQLIWRQALGGPVGPHAAFKSVMVDAVTLRLELQVSNCRQAESLMLTCDSHVASAAEQHLRSWMSSETSRCHLCQES